MHKLERKKKKERKKEYRDTAGLQMHTSLAPPCHKWHSIFQRKKTRMRTVSLQDFNKKKHWKQHGRGRCFKETGNQRDTLKTVRCCYYRLLQELISVHVPLSFFRTKQAALRRKRRGDEAPYFPCPTSADLPT